MIATIDDRVFAKTELIARVQLLVAHKAFEAAHVIDQMPGAHDQLVGCYALSTSVAFAWKPSMRLAKSNQTSKLDTRLDFNKDEKIARNMGVSL